MAHHFNNVYLHNGCRTHIRDGSSPGGGQFMYFDVASNVKNSANELSIANKWVEALLLLLSLLIELNMD